jgi:exodeoxyribonuclease III
MAAVLWQFVRSSIIRCAMERMKIATFNINNINKRFANLARWLDTARPDVVCLQELKCEHARFPAAALRTLEYEAVWKGHRSWNGVAILSRGHAPVLTVNNLPGDTEDAQSRYIEAAVNGVLIGCIYLPNGNPQPGPKFDYKLAWFKRLNARAARLYKTGAPAVLAGDFNVVPTDLDIYPTKSWDDDALLQPAPRAAFRRLIRQGWTDAVHKRHPEAPMYSYWSYKRNRWSRDAGLRLDCLLLSQKTARRLKDAGVDRWVRGEEGSSDHAPVWIELKL